MKVALATVLFISSFLTTAKAELLDKIVAIYNDSTITHSQVNRIKANLSARREIAPMIYEKPSLTDKEIVSIIVQKNLVHSKLEEMGYVITDDQVESNIKSNEQRMKINRDTLIGYLKSKGLTFPEYFEISRDSMEHNIFMGNVITPLISITEQEIKNSFYKKNAGNKTLAFKYTLVDFTLDKKEMKPAMLKEYRKTLESFQINGILPADFKAVQTNLLGDITEDGLTSEVTALLKKTDEGAFTDPVEMNNLYHVFFVKKKDLVESEIFLKSKEDIRQELFEATKSQITELWYSREAAKHYIRYFL